MDTVIHLLNIWGKLIFLFIFLFLYPIPIPVLILVPVPIPYSGFLLFQTPDLSSQIHNLDWLLVLSFRAFRMGRERQNGKTAKQNSITER